ncbi:MAG: hypothetical protein ABUL43_02705 [Hyphomicrobium sp.]
MTSLSGELGGFSVVVEREPAASGRSAGANSKSKTLDHAGSAFGSVGARLGLGGGNTALLRVGAAGLLAAAIVSVGLLGSTGPSDKQQGALQETNAGSLMQPLGSNESDQAIERLMMSAPEKDRVKAQLSAGSLKLAKIIVSDSDDEDGDWVRVSAGGFQQDVRLLHNPYTVIVPYVPGAPMSVIGLVDGGGGDITVAVHAGTGVLSLKPLKPGEVLLVPTP